MKACKICIALKGLKGSELKNCPYVFKTNKEFIKHLKEEHNLVVDPEVKK